MAKSSNSNTHTFSCQNCSHVYTVYPPDSGFLYAYISPFEEPEPNNSSNHNYRQFYECENCNHRNMLYWCSGHSFIES
jgi:hypothetical protein